MEPLLDTDIILESYHQRREEKLEIEREARAGDGVRDGVRGEPDSADDGGSEEEGREAAGAHLRYEGAVQQDQGQLEASPPPLRLLDLRAFQRPALLGCPNQPGPRPPRPLRRPPPRPPVPTDPQIHQLMMDQDHPSFHPS
uniref:Uncharacterized protein LOC105036559 isoform X1 n=1 Tax=Elaeis guineensis var. tenera TaxID=51953 RepID=A0A8N4EZ16_ELAGV|nr:uncharacterized protein LOC105036559 isoform X1 [Elaeis guineensis]